MKKILKSPMFWGSAIFLVVMFITLTATSFPQRDYGGQNPDA
tara:strand:- start:1358 stop:1483 length:126 start_codon:yes stop_codon:yes gene_type:complete